MDELPPVSPELCLLGALMRTLERRDPGFAEEMYGIINSDVMLARAVRIRGPRLTAEVTSSLDQARAWMALATVVRDREAEAVRRKRKKG